MLFIIHGQARLRVQAAVRTPQGTSTPYLIDTVRAIKDMNLTEPQLSRFLASTTISLPCCNAATAFNAEVGCSMEGPATTSLPLPSCYCLPAPTLSTADKPLTDHVPLPLPFHIMPAIQPPLRGTC